MKELWTTLLESLGIAWWVEIVTEAPHCTYYFGPFGSAADAEAAQSGYIQDLEQEKAQNIRAVVKRCKPDKLTIDDEAEASQRGKTSPLVSSRA